MGVRTHAVAGQDHPFDQKQSADSEQSLLTMVGLRPLMEVETGRQEVVIGLPDGPVALEHPDLVTGPSVRLLAAAERDTGVMSGPAKRHGTFVAGILKADRNSVAPAICPDCTLLVRPIVHDTTDGASDSVPSTTPTELAAAIMECVGSGAKLLNLSIGFARPSAQAERELEQALSHAARRGVLIVAAAGNQSTLGGSAIVSHPAVLPVVACDWRGRPVPQSNLSASVGRRGLRAPGENVTSLGVDTPQQVLGGTSVATPFVTGAAALLWSLFPAASAGAVKAALTRSQADSRTTVVPPLLNAQTAWGLLASTRRRSANR